MFICYIFVKMSLLWDMGVGRLIKGPVIKPSGRIQKEYQKALEAVIKRMNADLFKGIMAVYGRYESGLAQDAKMPAWLTGALNSLFKKWQSVFDSMAEKRAKWFNDQTEKASTKQVEAMLKDIGFTVEFKNSLYINDILQTQLKENVDLIKSIPAKAHEQVKAIVKHGVEAGSDRTYIAQHLQEQFGVTQRRAQFITRDQTNKANAAIAQARSKEAGIEYGFWMHRGGTKVPRPTHVAMQGKRFKLENGLYDSAEGRNVKPGELYNCNCAYRADLSSFNTQIAKDSVTVRPRPLTYDEVLKNISSPTRNAA